MTFRLTCTSLLPIAALALSGSMALSQQPTAPAAPPAPVERRPPAPAMRPGRGQGTMRPGAMQNQRNFRGGPSVADHGNLHGGFRGQQAGLGDSFRIGPAGMWWKNPTIVQGLSLTADQTKKMDDIFQKSRIDLIDKKANVEKQNALLEPLLSANPPDTAKALAQIDQVAEARADLEKTNARMLLGIRSVLTPDQWTKLHDRTPPAAPAAGAPGGQAGGPGGGRPGPASYGGGGYGGGGRNSRGAVEMDDTQQ